MARFQIRNLSPDRDYSDRKKADGKAPMEAMRCVKRRLSDIVYQQMLNDAMTHKGQRPKQQTVTCPGGHRGTSTDSSVTSSHPHAGSSEKSLPGPATAHPTTPLPTAS